MKLLKNAIIVLLATCGVRVDKVTVGRLIALALIITGYIIYLIIVPHIELNLILIYFFSLFLIRYIYLFGGFMKNGFSGYLIEKFGANKAWSIYEVITSVMFFQRGLSFGLLTGATQWSLLTIPGIHFIYLFGFVISVKYLCIAIGLLLVLVGFWINITASMVIGIDTYYYKDLFLKKALAPFKVKGPYKFFSNPMYGIGQSSAYGAALMNGSFLGILVTLLNQVTMYIFYFLIEKPHINAILKS